MDWPGVRPGKLLRSMSQRIGEGVRSSSLPSVSRLEGGIGFTGTHGAAIT